MLAARPTLCRHVAPAHFEQPIQRLQTCRCQPAQLTLFHGELLLLIGAALFWRRSIMRFLAISTNTFSASKPIVMASFLHSFILADAILTTLHSSAHRRPPLIVVACSIRNRHHVMVQDEREDEIT